MENHLTEKELIEYQFKLADEARMAEIAGHLDGCDECKRLRDRLAGKFASLELLRTDEKISEELISKTIEQVSKRRVIKQRASFLNRNGWRLSAAAVFVLVVMTAMVWQLEKRQMTKKGTTVARGTKIVQKIEKENIDLAKGIETKPELPVATTVAGRPAVSKEQIEDKKPPFAPASAIELVTLPKRENVQITIYNSADLTLVREKRNLTLKKGWNWLQFMWADTLIDPTSLQLEPKEQKDKIEIEQLVFPPRLRELGRWLIKSEIEGQVPFEITYFISGLSWRAFYMGTLNESETKMRLESYVRVENGSGEDYENAQTRLIVGTVHILDRIAELARSQWPYGSPVMRYSAGIGGGVMNVPVDSGVALANVADKIAFNEEIADRKAIIKEGLSEYFLYTIEGTETIENQWGKRLLSFEANNIDVNSLYKYDEDRYGPDTIRFVSFINDKKHNLGQTPIPNGNVKIYSIADSNGYLSYVGGADIKYIPVNEEVELNLGSDRLVKVEPVLMNFETDNFRFDNNKDIIGWDEIRNWQVTITNTKSISVDIEITRNFNTAYWDLELKDSGGVEYKKYDAEHTRFNLKLEPQSKKVFEYKVRTYHGKRQEEINL
jgi:hypothetical protein